MTQFASGIGAPRHAARGDAHVGDIRGALGTIAHDDTSARGTWRARLRTLLAILCLLYTSDAADEHRDV